MSEPACADGRHGVAGVHHVRVRIALLGPTEVSDDAGTLVAVGPAKQRAVLAQLAREPNRAVPVDRLAEGLWGERVPARYRQNLQVYVSRWRSLLDPGRPAGTPSRIVGHREAYELVSATGEVDVSQFLADAEAGTALLEQGRPEESAATLRTALARWRGQPLVDLADQPFAGEWADELEQRRVDVLERRIDADLARGRSAGLIPELELLVRRHPLRERFWQQLAVAQYREGRQADALDTAANARALLLDELGLDPGPALQRLEEQILRQDPVLLALAPVTVSAPVPVPLTAAVGREQLIGHLVSRLAGGSRLLVLSGPGGVGKTRLALAAGHALVAAGRSVLWVPLADEADATRVDGHIAGAAGWTGPPAGLADELAERRAVLLVDNVEQLPGVSTALRDLLERSGTVQMLVTSRGPVGVPGEEVVDVPPLRSEDDQIQLFTERARAVDPLFEGGAHRADIARACRAVDGLPLGIELLAARSRSHQPGELADALEQGDLTMAAEPRHDGRHGSLANCVRWSMELLPSSDRAVLAALSAFDGTVDRSTVAAVSDDREALDRLVQLSLVRPLETPAGRRFAMLATVRAVAAAHRSDIAASGVWERIARMWVERSQQSDPGGRADEQEAARSEADLPTTIRVVGHLLETGRAAEAATVVLALHHPFVRLDRYADLRRLSEQVLAAGPGPADRVRLAAVAAQGADRLNDPNASALLPEVDDLPTEDHVWRAKVHYIRSTAGAYYDHASRAEADARAGLAEALMTGRPALIASAYGAASFAALRRRDPVAALEFAREQADWVTDDVGRCIQLNDLALAALNAGDEDEAEDALSEAIVIAVRISPRRYLEWTWKLMASVRLRRDQAAEAASLLSAALAEYGPAVDLGWALEACAEMGLATVMAGRRDAGIRILRRANGYALPLGADNALPDRDEPTAVRHGVGVGSYGAPLPAVLPFPDFVTSVRGTASSLAPTRGSVLP